ncbi:S10 family peptidase [Roseiterribacter gracilis]|uniref:Peptidase S10 n=1 Tax=Roseiterribacter gracilis TaxID=2812848 RepID=A0A8S8XKI3_9PROT|nr:peptidase S10 [Rhodospirillales bacterium TMPK1]
MIAVRALWMALLVSVPAIAADNPVKLDAPVVTHGSGTFNGKHVAYDATVEPIVVANAEGKPAARLVVISYVASGAADPKRPLLFVFNGGPIGPSAILHIGAIGPKRVAVPDDLKADPASFQLVDNPYALLDVADLVFFDPAGTGLSRVLDGVDPKSYYSNEADAQQLVQLVIDWSKLHGRSAAPKYLLGESYGTMRAVEAAAQLEKTDSKLDGIALLGQAVNINDYAQRARNIVSFVASLPTLAATAWSHDRAERKGRSFDKFIQDAEAFGRTDYLQVLYLGDQAPQAQRDAVARRLQEFTGIAADEQIKRNLRITKEQYRRLLFPGQLLGLNDARYIGPEAGGDPSSVVPRAYVKAFDLYLRDTLHVDAGTYLHDSPFKGGLNEWGWGANRSPFGDWNYTQLVTDVMQKNPTFRVLVGNGYTDTQTTVGAMDYLVAQSTWPRERVRAARYAGGHMAYSVESSLRQISSDLRALVTGAW